MAKKFKCVRAWSRNAVGDVIEEYEYKRYPPSAHKCFEEIIDTPVQKKVNVPVNTSVKSSTKLADKE